MVSKNELRVGVKFDVDNKQLEVSKQKLSELITGLDQIQNKATQAKLLGDIDKDLEKAAKEAEKVKQILNSSWNSKLGQLDFSKFNASLKQSYQTVGNLKTALSGAGVEGVAAFNGIASSVLNSNIELKKTSTILDKMALTMANTVRFGISSSIFNTLTSSISKAYNYAKDLDSSLNSIRIVSGQSADQMERYAKYANQAAKELGASTLDYTDASLIYYQQGLSEDEVLARTDVTIKAANALGASAEEVSQYMTSIWNNFDNGSKSLEYYADVITALGANTASSAEEIATGLEKFSAVAGTVGLSYEYATTALATVVAQTKQSADTVGTAFKTIFARMQDLKLGNTLEDGTTLGKYSATLEKAGISVRDQNGQLRQMDDILNDMGSKWQTLNGAQKVALAQGVAGVRQYTQLVALMDNWDKFNENLEIAGNATGTLQKQQDIYMDSVEAHLQKMRTEAEKTYDILFDTDTVNGFADALTGVIGLFNSLITGLGGGTQAFVAFGAAAANIFNKQIGASIERQIENYEAFKSNLAGKDLKNELISTIKGRMGQEGEWDSSNARVEGEVQIAEKLAVFEKNITAEERAQWIEKQKQVGLNNELIDKAEHYTKYLEDANEKEDIGTGFLEDKVKIARQELEAQKEIAKYIEIQSTQASSNERAEAKRIRKEFKDPDYFLKRKGSADQEAIIQELEQAGGKIFSQADSTDLLQRQNDLIAEQETRVKNLTIALEGKKAKEDGSVQAMKEYNEEVNKEADRKVALEQRQQAISGLIQAMSTLVQIYTTISGLVKTWNDNSLDLGEKVKATVTTLLTAGPMIIMTIVSISKQLPTIAIGLKLIDASNYKIAKSAGVAGAALWSAFWPFLAVAAAVVVAIGSIVAIVNQLSNEYNANKRAAENAAKAAKQVEEAHKGIVDAVKALDSNLTSYDNAIDKLKNCTKGTKEWEKSLLEVNDVVRTVLKNVGSLSDVKLSDLYSLNKETGQFELNTEKIQSIIEQGRKQEYSSALAADEMNYKSARAQFTQQLEDIVREMRPENYLQAMLKGAQEGSPAGLIGMGVGAGISVSEWDAINDAILLILNNNLEEVTKQVSLEDFSKTIQGLGIDVSNLEEKELKQLQNRLIELNETLGYANDQLETLSTQDIINLLGGDADATTATLIKSRVQQDITNGSISIQSTIDKMAENETWWSSAKTEYNDLLNRLQKAGYSNLREGQDIVQGSGQDRKLEFRDSSTDQLITMTAEEVATKILAYETTQEIDKQQKSLQEDYEKLQQAIGEENTKLVKDFWATGNLGEFTPQQISTLRDIVNSGQLSGIASGYQTPNFEEANKNLKISTDNLLSGYNEAIKWSFEKGGIDTSNLSLESKKLLLDKLTEIFGEGNQGALDAITQFYSKLAPEELQQYLNNLQNPETSNAEKIETALSDQDDKLKAQGIDKEELADYSRHLMEIANKTEHWADENKDLADSLNKDEKAAIIVAKSIMRMNNGIEELNKNQEDWIDKLRNSIPYSEEYHDSLQGIRKTFENLFDLSDGAADILNGDFFVQNAEDIALAAEGDIEAIDKLRIAMADASFENLTINLDDSQLDAALEKYNTVKDYMLQDFELGSIDDTNFVNACNELIAAAGWTAEQANQQFEKMGFDATLEYDKDTVTYQVPVTHKYHEIVNYKSNPDGTASWEEVERTKTEYEEPNGEVPSYAMAIDTKTGKPAVPHITKIVKKGTGSSNNYSSKNAGGGSVGGSKSGGGGGSKAKDPNKMDKLDDQADRYHKVNTQITKVDNSLKKLQSQESKLVGANLIENLNQQWAQLNIQVNNYNEKLRIAQDETDELNKKLAGQGVEFNADGTISNYMEIFAAKQDYVNSLIDKYNNMSAEEQETYKDTVEKAKEDFKEFQKDLDRYDILVSNEIPNLRQSIQDAIDKEIEINIKKFNMKVSISLDMKQATLDWNKWKTKVLDEIPESDLLGNTRGRMADFSAYYSDDGFGTIQIQAQHLEDTLKELHKMDAGQDNVYGDNRAQALEDLQTYYKQLMEDLEGVLDLQNEIHQAYMDMMDEAQEKFKEQLDTYQMIGDLLNNNMKIIQLVYGEDAYKDLMNYYDKQYQNNLQELDFLRQQRDLWAEQMDIFAKERDQFKEGTLEWDRANQKWESAKEKWAESAKELSSTLVNAIQAQKEAYENTVNSVIQDFENTITNGMGFSYLDKEWELINKEAEQYLDTVDAVIGLRDLEAKYVDAINKTSNLETQQKLNKMMKEELDTLNKQGKLSQADLDRANLKYQLALAQANLEEAQQNKSQMRLRRDSQGNYTYQYVADTDAINKAKEELSNLYAELYHFDRDQYKAGLEQMLELNKAFQQELSEVYKINDPEKRAAQEKLVREKYNTLIENASRIHEKNKLNLTHSSFQVLSIQYKDNLVNWQNMTQEEQKDLLEKFTGENGITTVEGEAFGTLAEMYGTNSTNWANMTEAERQDFMNKITDPTKPDSVASLLTGWYNDDAQNFTDHVENIGKTIGDASSEGPGTMVGYWKSGINEMANVVSGSDGKGGFVKISGDAFDEIAKATKEYKTQVDTLVATAGTEMDEIKSNLGDIQATQNTLSKNADIIKKYTDKLGDMKKLTDEIDKQAKDWKKVSDNAKSAADEAYRYWMNTQKNAATAAQNQAKTTSSAGNAGNTNAGAQANAASSQAKSSGGDGVPRIGDLVTYLGGEYYNDSYGGGPTGNRGPGKKVKITYLNDGAPYPIHVESSDSAFGWLRKDQIEGYATGGYTGDWQGINGKLALLHQKELVLNAEDTTNLLNTVSIIRNLANTLGGNVLSKLAGVAAKGAAAREQQELQQNVKIDATFPNVRDAREIENALNNLVNSASQRMFEKR